MFIINRLLGFGGGQGGGGTHGNQTDGTPFGNMTDFGGLSAAFDGNLSQVDTSCAARNAAAGLALLGLQFPDGRTITSFGILTPNNRSDFCSGGGSCTVRLLGGPDQGNVTTELHNSTSGTPGTSAWANYTTSNTTHSFTCFTIELGTAGAGGRSICEAFMAQT